MSAAPGRSGRVEYTAASHLITTGGSRESARESLLQPVATRTPLPKGRNYLTAKRVAAVKAEMNHRQWAITFDVGRLGIVSGQQLGRLHYESSAGSERLRRKDLATLVQSQVLDRLGRRVGGVRAGSAGYVYALGVAGQRLLDPDRRRYYPRWTPRPSYLRHALAVSELYVDLKDRQAAFDMELLSYDTEPACWRRYFGPGGARSVLKPDALAVVGRGELEYRYFVEMDCGTEHRPHIVVKAKAYARYWQSGREQSETGIFPFVLWVAPDLERAGVLVDALAALPAEHWRLFLVTTADTAATHMASGHAHELTNGKEVR